MAPGYVPGPSLHADFGMEAWTLMVLGAYEHVASPEALAAHLPLLSAVANNTSCHDVPDLSPKHQNEYLPL